MTKSYVGLLACPRCGEPTGVIMDSRMKDTFDNGHRYAGDLCETCKEEMVRFAEIVSHGGVYFRCTMCDKSGVIIPSDSNREFLLEIRTNAIGEDDPELMSKPCGVQFSKCEQHSADEDENNGDNQNV